MSIKSEVMNAGVRVVAKQLITGVKFALGKLVASDKSKKIVKSKTATGVITSAVGFTAAALTDNSIIGGVAQEARILGMAGAASGIIDTVIGNKDDEEEKKDK